MSETDPTKPDKTADERPPDPAPEGPGPQDPLRGSRTSGVWLAVVSSGVVLVLLVVFIAQNTDSVRISFLGWEGEAPLAVALLVATVAGLFLAAIAGTLRIWQLRRRVRRGSR